MKSKCKMLKNNIIVDSEKFELNELWKTHNFENTTKDSYLNHYKIILRILKTQLKVVI